MGSGRDWRSGRIGRRRGGGVNAITGPQFQAMQAQHRSPPAKPRCPQAGIEDPYPATLIIPQQEAICDHNRAVDRLSFNSQARHGWGQAKVHHRHIPPRYWNERWLCEFDRGDPMNKAAGSQTMEERPGRVLLVGYEGHLRPDTDWREPAGGRHKWICAAGDALRDVERREFEAQDRGGHRSNGRSTMGHAGVPRGARPRPIVRNIGAQWRFG